jgi:hypothetical protein
MRACRRNEAEANRNRNLIRMWIEMMRPTRAPFLGSLQT